MRLRGGGDVGDTLSLYLIAFPSLRLSLQGAVMQYRQSRLMLAAGLVLAGCRSYDAATAPSGSSTMGTARYDVGHASHASLPHQQLAEAKAAAARYHDVRKAIADGYHDTGIVLPNMGRHFIKDDLVDTK